ncbi:MAG: DUF4347 domain-containing protein [Planctomycetota bacterium]
MKFVDVSKSIANWFCAQEKGSNTDSVTGMVELMSLEERVLYSAAPVPVDVDAGSHEVPEVDFDESFFASIEKNLDLIESGIGVLADDSLDLSGLERVDEQSQEIVIVDRSVDDYQTLVDDILASADHDNIRIEFIDVDENGVARISELLSAGIRYEALHLVAHGSDGELVLGQERLNSSTLERAGIDGWQSGLSGEADILIYGCDVAQTDSGKAFVDRLAEITGADIAASDDYTGHRDLGGDWHFEYLVGQIDTGIAFSRDVTTNWAQVLVAVDTSTEGGYNADRSIAADANGNVYFAFTSTTEGVDGEDIIVTGFNNVTDASLFPAFVANTTTSGDQHWATIAAAENGDFVVVWHTYDGIASDLYARGFYADGTEKFAEFQIDPGITYAEDPVISMDRFGNFAVTYEGRVSGLIGSYEIYVHHYDEFGNQIQGQTRVNDSTSGDQFNSSVALNDNGEMAVSWRDSAGDLYYKKYASDGSSAGEVLVSTLDTFHHTSIAINESGYVVVAGSYTESSNDDIFAAVYRPDGTSHTLTAHPASTGSQRNVSVAILDNNDVAVSWEGESAALADSQGTYFSIHQYNSGSDDWSTAIDEVHMQSEVSEQGQSQKNASVTTARGEAFVFGFSQSDNTYVVSSFAKGLNQTPTSSNSTVTSLENSTWQFDGSDFNYSDHEGDSISRIAIRSLPSVGQLLYSGTPLVQADIDSTPDGFEIDIADIGNLTYEPPSDQYGYGVASFDYRVNDGQNYSVNDSTMTIDINAEDRIWISNNGSGSAVGSIPDYTGAGTLQLGGSGFRLGLPSAGDWSRQFNLDSFGYNIEALHYVSSSVDVGDYTLNAGDILFSIDGNGSLPLELGNASLGTFDFNDEDIIVFRSTAPDYSTGFFELLIDSSDAESTDPLMNFGSMYAFTLIESDTTIGNQVIDAGSILFTPSGSNNRDVLLMNVATTGEDSTSTSTSLLIDGSDLNLGHKIEGLDVVEQTTTIGGQVLNAGTVVMAIDNSNTIFGSLATEHFDLVAIDLTTTSVGNTASGSASILLDGSSVDLDSTGSLAIDAFSLLGRPDNNAPSITDQTVSISEHATAGDLVIDITATDADHVEGDFVYSFDGGNTNGAFAIDSTTGEITVNNANELDFETTPTYSLVVRVEDPDGEFDRATISVNLTDVTEPGISGTIFDDVGADGSIASDAGLAGVSVYLYADLGGGIDTATLVATTTTDSSGRYVFNEIKQNDYFIVVDSSTISSGAGYNTGFSSATVWAEQTYSTAGAVIGPKAGLATTATTSSGAFFGGAEAGISDDASTLLTAQHINFVSVTNADVTGIDYGFSFNVVTNVNDSAAQEQGTLRQFINNANAISGANAMRFVPAVASNESVASEEWWRIAVTTALPVISDSNTIIDGQAYFTTGGERDQNTVTLGTGLTADGTVGTGADGVAGTGDEVVVLSTSPSGGTNSAGLDAPELEIFDDAGLAWGLVVRATDDAPVIQDIEIRNISIYGFGATVGEGANIWVDGSGYSSSLAMDKQVSNVTITGNVVGISAGSGSGSGALLSTESSDNIRVTQADSGFIYDNIVAFANDVGIKIEGDSAGDGADGWEIVGNVVYGNGSRLGVHDGIDLKTGSNFAFIYGNLIFDNYGSGIDSWGGGDGHTIRDNTITGNGISVVETTGVRIFGDAFEVTRNIIAGNTGPGVHIVGAASTTLFDFDAAARALVSMNSFYGNTGNAIDLSASLTGGLSFNDLDLNSDGVLSLSESPAAMQSIFSSVDSDSSNDLSEAEFVAASSAVLRTGDSISVNDDARISTSGNEGMDYLELQKIGLEANGSLSIVGQIDPSMNLTRVEIYLTDSGTGDSLLAMNYGEGRTFIGALEAGDFTLAVDGRFEGVLSEPFSGWPAGVTSLQEVSVIAIDSSNNTSEFSNNVTINQVPVAANSSQNGQEDNQVVLRAGDFNFTDQTGDSLVRIRISTLPTNGTLYFEGSPITSSLGILATDLDLDKLTYEPNGDFYGVDSFTFRVHDGTHLSTAAAVFEIHVDPVNDAPDGIDNTISLAEDGDYTFDVNDFGFNDLAPGDGHSLLGVIVSTLPGAGTLELNGSSVFEGQALNASQISQLVYVPESDVSGPGADSFTFQVIDDGGTANGGSDRDPVPNTITFDVAPSNDSPSILTGNVSIPEGMTVVTTLTAADVDSTSLSFNLTGDGADDKLFNIDPATNELRFNVAPEYRPHGDADGDGIYEVGVRVDDGSGGNDSRILLVTVTNALEEAPVFSRAADFVIAENQSVPFSIGRAVDADGDSITYSLDVYGDYRGFTFNSTLRTLTFVSPPDYEAAWDAEGDNVYVVRVRATDDTLRSTTLDVTIEVTPENDNAPVFNSSGTRYAVAENSNETFSFAATDADLPGDDISYHLSGNDAWLFEIDDRGNVSFADTPDFENPLDNGANNVYSITVTADDNDGRTTATNALIAVTQVDEATVVANDSGFGVDSGQTLTVSSNSILANDFDPDSTLSIRIVGTPVGGTAALDSDGNVVFTADSEFAGTGVVRYVAVTETGAESDAAEIQFDVRPILNVAPVVVEETKTESETERETTTEPDLESENEEQTGDSTGPLAGGVASSGDSAEEVIAGAINRSGSEAQSDNSADTNEGEAALFDSTTSTGDFANDDAVRAYVYQTVSTAVDIDDAATVRSFSSQVSTMLSTFDPSTLVAYWDDVDSAREDFMVDFDFTAQPLVASVTSVLTVGYVAWLIRGGVLLTTFMSSIPAWQAFDPLPVIEQGVKDGDDGDDESIEKLVN